MKERLVVIGNGMAGVRTVEEILERDPDRYEITIIGGEQYPNYNRIMLSNVLQKKMTVDEIITNPTEWYLENQIILKNADPAVGINSEVKRSQLNQGKLLPMTKLFSLPVLIPLFCQFLEQIRKGWPLFEQSTIRQKC